jgi:Alanyl-tRNA synthetase
MFEFLAKEVGLDPKNIYVTAFRGLPEAGIPKDEETANIWKELFAAAGVTAAAVDFAETGGMQNGRIFYYDEKRIGGRVPALRTKCPKANWAAGLGNLL